MTGTGFTGRVAALATRHGKLPIVAPPLERSLGIRVTLADLDTDAFGTFAGDIPRLGSPLDTAVAKARAAMRAGGTELGLASEGTIGPDPVTGLAQLDTELVVLVDDRRGLVITGQARSHGIVAGRHVVDTTTDLGPLLHRLDSPHHGVIVMPEGEPAAAEKGLSDADRIADAVARACAAAATGRAVIASDLRAHCSPSRRAVIARAAEDLAERASSTCPSCARPGWGRIGPLLGRACRACGGEAPALARGVVDGCDGCGLREERELDTEPVDPSRCPACNP